jgi:hypothetical protein
MIEPQVSGGTHSNGRVRTTALFGTGAALLMSLIQSGSVTENEFGPTIWIIAAVVAALLTVFRSGRKLLWARPELLIPIGFALPLQAMVGWLSSLPKLEFATKPIAELSLWGGGFVLSLPQLLYAAIWSAYAAWQTDLLIRVLERPTSAELDFSPWEPIRRGFWRAFGALFIGMAGLQLATVPITRIFIRPDHSLDEASFSGFAFLVCLASFFWSAATLALLPRVLINSDPFWTAAKDGMRISLRNILRWSVLTSVHLALLGVFTYYSSHSMGRSDFSGSVHGLWIGGYPGPTFWYADYQSWLKLEASPFVLTLLTGLILVLAVAVKVPIIQSLLGKPGKLSAELAPEMGETMPVEAAV